MTATDRVFTTLRESIVTGQLVAGSQHSIYRLAEQLEVSRTPVRDAVLRLADLGLVTIERNRGVRVRGVTPDDVRAVFELRALIEVPAASYAASHASADDVAQLVGSLEAMRAAAPVGDEAGFTGHDRALHASIAAVLGNARVTDELSRLRDSIQARGVSTIGRSRPAGEVAEEHAPIVDAVSAGDAAAAARHMMDHLERTATLLMRQVSSDGVASEEVGAEGPGSERAVPPADWAERIRGLVL